MDYSAIEKKDDEELLCVRMLPEVGHFQYPKHEGTRTSYILTSAFSSLKLYIFTHNYCVDDAGIQFHASKHRDVKKSRNEWPCGHLKRPKESHRTHKFMQL